MRSKLAKTKLSKNVLESQIQLLADYIYDCGVEDGSLFLDALNSMKDIFLIEALSREFKQLPNSPISVELRRALRKISREKAAKIAKEILVAEDHDY